MTTIKNVFKNYINQDEIYDNVVNAKHPRMSLKPAISICMILLVCLVGQSFMNEKRSNQVKDDIDKIVINNLSENDVTNKDYLLVQANPDISNQNSFYEENPFIKQLEKDYDWEVYYARLPNDDDLKAPGDQKFIPLYTVVKFINNEKQIEIKITKKDILNKTYDDLDPSIINDKSIIIYKNKENYYALYEKDSVYYEVKSTNLNENEFIENLQLIIEE